MLEDLAKAADAGGGQRLDRPGRNAIDPYPMRSNAAGQIAHRCLQAGLGQAHGVVVRHHPISTQVTQRQHGRGAVAHQRQRRLGQRGKTVGADIMRNPKGFARQAVEKIAGDGLARCEGDGMHQTVQALPLRPERGKQRGDVLIVGDIADIHLLAAQFGRHLGDAILETFVLVGEGQLRTFAGAGLGNAPGDGTIAEQSSDEDAFAGKKSHVGSP